MRSPASGRPPKLLLVTPYLSPVLGGVEQYVLSLARLLVHEHGWRVVLVSTFGADTDRAAAERLLAHVDGVTVRWLPRIGRVSNTPVGLGWFLRLRRIIAQERPDVVNGHAPVPGLGDLAARAAGRLPFVLTYHSGALRKQHRAVDLALRAYERVVLRGTVRRSAHVICASEWVERTLCPGVGPARSVVPPGVDTAQFHPAEQAPTGHRVLFVGSLDVSASYKGLQHLLVAVARLRANGVDATLEVVGDGDRRSWYVDRARVLGVADAVCFTGALSRQALPEAYRRASVLAVPSTFDNFPTVAVEAMASGLPVVASRVGSIPDLVVDAVTGRIVEPGDAAALAEALRDVLLDPEARRRMGEAGRDRVGSTLTASMQAARTSRVLTEVARRPPTRVAVVTPDYPPDLGGVERYAERLVQALARSPHHSPVVLTSSAGRRTTVDRVDGVTVVRLGRWFVLSNSPVNPMWLWQVRRWLRRLDVDVVNAHAPVPFLADVTALVAGRPVVLTYHAGTLVKGGARVDPLLRAYERWVLPRVLRWCVALIAVSPVSFTHRFGAELIPGGVDVSRFTPPVRPRATRLLYVGRIERSSRWKGLHVLLEAMPAVLEKVPDATLAVAGDGDALPDMKVLARQLGLGDRVTWHGGLAGDELVAEYQSASALVLPSLTDAENSPLVVMEAMACGTPVVASRVGGIPYLVQHGVNGYLAEPGNADSLAGACVDVLLDRESAHALGATGRAIAERRWSWDQQTDKMIAVLDRVAASAP